MECGLLAEYYNEVHAKGKAGENIKSGVISLLYKKKDRRDLRNYRPITLLNGEYKILTRILCRRMKKVVGYTFRLDYIT